MVDLVNDTTVAHLRKNFWLDQFTRALTLRLTGYSVQHDRYFILTLLAESVMGSGWGMRVSLTVEEVRLETRQWPQIFGQVCLVTFFLMTCFWFIKVALELNYGGALATNSAEIVNISLHITSIILFEVSFYMKMNETENHLDSEKFVNLQTYASLDNLASVCFSLSAIFYPFRLFMLMARYNWAESMVGLLNTIYRTLPGVAMFLIMSLCILLGWGLAFYLVFAE